MKECPNCKTVLEDDEIFCHECGAKQEVEEVDSTANDEMIARKIKQIQERKERKEKRRKEKAAAAAAQADAAKTSALSLAVTNLAGQIQTEVTALVENTVANKQLEANEAASIAETVMSSKNLISQSIGRTITVVECYREVKKNGNKEVLVRIAYNGEMAKQAAKKAVREELEKKGANLHEQLDKVLGF